MRTGRWAQFDVDSTAPILLVQNQFDPATAYEGAVRADAVLANAAFLTVTG
jgi:TAP-like protein